ncbi:sphingomyelin phosphodiesterase [Aureobasidium pullulans]|uniref:Sphingomyelin phosphodiesterase n=1 Tax=Aureobasidium pullulans TaxID=5580 RepID=A0A4S8TFN4_AURPU|nr:sphingomyelin phosphodiesterase [Aureobasidium pullulans]THW35959.1 sphingomyelin phosphodiesterase [Aureobasidium pullulans]THX89535.1 sphingomyelin phosphodiesterase [Aureobasidium pullulans]
MKLLPLVSVGLFFAQSTSASSVQKRDTVSDVLNDIKNAATCTACQSLLGVLQAVAHLGNDAFVGVITAVCQSLGVEDADVCAGAIGLEGPILAHDLREMTIGSHTAQHFCGTIFGLCDYPAVTPYTVTFPSAKPAGASRPASSGKTPLKVVHYSDIHVDLSYQVGANYNCTKNICCRPYTAADAPGKTQFPAGQYGNTQCDSPRSLEQSMYNAIKTLVPDAAFSIFTGDIVEGAVWLVNQTEVINDLNNAYSLMSTLGMPVYGVVGNHDAAPVNSFPPAAVDTTISSQWVYDTLSADWTKWIGSAAASNADKYGAYSVKNPNTNLRVVSFNTNLYYKQNFWLYETTMENDPSGQLAWLVGELDAAEKAGERVWLLGHMPMGAGDAFHDGSNYFNQIVKRYSATIAAQFYGHTHKDEFQITYSDYTKQTAANAVDVSYIAPALTPTSGNPTFRVYSIDPVTFGVLDYTVYFANISSPTYQNGPTWQKYYSVKETYGAQLTPPVTTASAELTPAFWHNLTTLFQTNDAVFQQFNARKSRGHDVSSCTGDCKTSSICQLRAAEAQYNCVTIKPGVNFKKRDLAADITHSDECDGSAGAKILGALTENIGAFQEALEKQLGAGFMGETVNGTAS